MIGTNSGLVGRFAKMPPTISQMSAIERSLGEVTGGIKSILRELDALKVERREDVDAQSVRMDRLETDLNIVGQTAAQARDTADKAKSEVLELKETVHNDIKPQTDNLKRISLKAMGFLTAVAFLGGVLGNPALAAFGAALDKFLK